MNIIIADSGSTKTDWAFVADGQVVSRLNSPGINPAVMDEETIIHALDALNDYASPTPSASVHKQASPEGLTPDRILFYGAGCIDSRIDIMKALLHKRFPTAKKIEVASDLLAAAHALFADRPGIACILGTGANSGLYDGSRITKNIPPLGYILGDEGSGAVLGKMFLNALFKKRLSPELKAEFLEWAGMTYSDIIDRVYRQPLANRFLASTSIFIAQHLSQPGIAELVKDNFRLFFRNNVARYQHPELPVGAIGSMAWHYQDQLRETASEEGFHIGTIIQSPMNGLIDNLSIINPL